MLFGRYRLVSTLARGARGTVYEAFDPDTRRRVALRVVPIPAASAKRGLLVRLRKRRRDRAIAQLAHPNIVALLAQGHADESQFIATEFVEGLPLPTYLESVGTLPVLQGLALTVQLLAALGFAHGRGQVHGAIHPGNVLVTRAGQLKVSGFGWAAGDPGAPVPGRFHVPLYLAPEQRRGAPADAHADLYSAALVAQLLLGGGPPSHPVANLPPKVAAVFARALAEQPQDRYRDAESLCSALQVAVGAPVWDRAALPASAASVASTDAVNEVEPPGVAAGPSTAAQALSIPNEPLPSRSPQIELTTTQPIQPEPAAWTPAEAVVFSRFAAATPPTVEPEQAAVDAPIQQSPQQGRDDAQAEHRAPVAAPNAAQAATLPQAGNPHRRHRKRGLALAAAAALTVIVGAALFQQEPAPESVVSADGGISSAPVATSPAPAVVGSAPAVPEPHSSVMGAAPAVDASKPVIAAPAVDAPKRVVAAPEAPLAGTASAQPSPTPVAQSQSTIGSTREAAAVPRSVQVKRPPARQATQESQEARVSPARQPTARIDSDQQRSRDTTSPRQERNKPNEPRRPARPQVAQAYDLHVGCRQDAALTREVCKAIRCASSEFERHPVCVRRMAEQRARNSERELYSGGR